MCSPALGVALGSAVVGSAMQMQGQRQAQAAQSRTMAAEQARQDSFAAASRDRVGTATDRVGAPATIAATEAATADRAAELRRVSTPATGQYLPGQGDAPQIVRDEIERRRAEAAGYLDQQGDARARLGGWGDALFGARQEIGRSGQDVATEAGFARGSAAVLPAELRAAQQRGQGWRTAGDLVTAGGMLGAPYASKGWNWAFGGPAAPMATTGRFPGPV